MLFDAVGERELKIHFSNCLNCLKELKKQQIPLMPQTLYREDYAALSNAHCMSNYETSEMTDLTKILLMKSYAIPRQLKGPPIISSSIINHAIGLPSALPSPILGRTPIHLRTQIFCASSTLEAPTLEQRQITRHQSPLAVTNTHNEMPSQKCEKTFKSVVFHWERLGIDECFVKGSQMWYLKKE